jgi:cation diffusion facilitator family transporter
MASGESKTAVVAAVLANLAIAVAKFAAAAFTGSSAMIAEGIHSLVDTGNGGLLLHGMKKSAVPADTDHPFGHGKAIYFWALIVAMSIFGIGGGMSIYEGITHLYHPSPLENPIWNYVVLGFSFIVEGVSFSIALKHFNEARGEKGVWKFIRDSKDPSLYTVVLEDTAAMLGLLVAFLGVLFGHAFGNPYFDGAASIVIGLLLIGVAGVLGVETQGLLLGEGISTEETDALRALVEADPAVEWMSEMMTSYFGPNDLLVNLGVQFTPDLPAEDVHRAIHRIEDALKTARPEIGHVYIEVESLRPATA